MRRVLVILTISWLLLFGLAVWIVIDQPKSFRVIFFAVGQGDSALLRFTNGEQMLIDCGSDKKILSKLGKYLPFYDRTIDYLVISHFDLDHYGGCIDVLRRYRVRNVIHNGSSKSDDQYWREWDRHLRAVQPNQLVIDSRYRIDIASTTLDFLWPLQLVKEENANSVVMRVEYGVATLLFAGDLAEEEEEALVDRYCPFDWAVNNHCPILRSGILKVSHHGSGGSSSEVFLRAVMPTVAVISVGKNTFGHPSERVIKKLARINAVVRRTDQSSDVIFSF